MKVLRVILYSVCITFFIVWFSFNMVRLPPISTKKSSHSSEFSQTSPPKSTFVRVSQASALAIYRETNTDVLYVIYQNGYKGGLTVMLNVDGKPLTYQEWLSFDS